jgi:hypothetical protein
VDGVAPPARTGQVRRFAARRARPCRAPLDRTAPAPLISQVDPVPGPCRPGVDQRAQTALRSAPLFPDRFQKAAREARRAAPTGPETLQKPSLKQEPRPEALCRTRTGDPFLTMAVRRRSQMPSAEPKCPHRAGAGCPQPSAPIRTVRHPPVPPGYLEIAATNTFWAPPELGARRRHRARAPRHSLYVARRRAGRARSRARPLRRGHPPAGRRDS